LSAPVWIFSNNSYLKLYPVYGQTWRKWSCYFFVFLIKDIHVLNIAYLNQI